MHWIPRAALALTGAANLAAALQEPQTVLAVTAQSHELPFLDQARDILSRYIDLQSLSGRATQRTAVLTPSSVPDICSSTGTLTRLMSSATSENAPSKCCQNLQREWPVMSTFRDYELEESEGARCL